MNGVTLVRVLLDIILFDYSTLECGWLVKRQEANECVRAQARFAKREK